MVWLAWFAAGIFFMCTCSLIVMLIAFTRAERIEDFITIHLDASQLDVPRGKYTLDELIEGLTWGGA